MLSITAYNPSEVAATEFLNAQHGGFAKILIEAKQLASMPSKAWIHLAVMKYYTARKPCLPAGRQAIHSFDGAIKHCSPNY